MDSVSAIVHRNQGVSILSVGKPRCTPSALADHNMYDIGKCRCFGLDGVSSTWSAWISVGICARISPLGDHDDVSHRRVVSLYELIGPRVNEECHRLMSAHQALPLTRFRSPSGVNLTNLNGSAASSTKAVLSQRFSTL